MRFVKSVPAVLITVLIVAVFAAGSCGRGEGDGGRGDTTVSGSPALTGLGIDAIADAAEKSVDGVVNISSTRMVRTADPFFDNPLFRNLPGNRDDAAKSPQQSLGSGVIVKADGTILTNNHVVEGATELTVILRDGRTFGASVVGADPESDLAVIRLNKQVKGLKPLPFGDSDKLRLGEVVLAIGNPFGLGHTVTMGIVSAKGRSGMGIAAYEDFIQTDAAINPGNSGGALVNLRGELVGINTAIESRSGGSQGVGFAIPSSMARGIVRDLESSGKVVHGWLGIRIQDVTPDLAETMNLTPGQGVLIGDVYRDSPGSRAGLRPGDVILGVEGKETDSVTQLRGRIAELGAGSKVTLRILRDHREMVVAATLTERPGNARRSSGTGTGGGNVLDGISVAPLTASARREYNIGTAVSSGVVVTGVESGSPAAVAGIAPGDVVFEINRRPIPSPEAFAREYGRSAGKLLLSVFREGARLFVVLEK